MKKKYITLPFVPSHQGRGGEVVDPSLKSPSPLAGELAILRGRK